MIKKIIFDLDNTLMTWEKEYIFALKNTLNKLNLDYDIKKIEEIDSMIPLYEKEYSLYTKLEFCEFLNRKCKVNLPIEFADILIEEQTKCYKEFTSSEIKTLEYLSSKYELLVLSNWFTYTQKKRLENSKILKYFTVVSGGDERELKPSLKAFDIVDNKCECVMVGDSIENDIKPALKLGMQAILITKNKRRGNLKYKKINKIEQLKEML